MKSRRLREKLLDILDNYAEARQAIKNDVWYEVNAKSLNSILDEVSAFLQTNELESILEALLTTLQTEVDKLPSWDADDLYDDSDLIQRSKIIEIINKLRNEGM